MKKTKIEININDFPRKFHDLLKESNIYDSSSNSGAKVFYIDSGYYLKMDGKGELREEAELTRRFFLKGLGVEMVSYISAEKDYMLTRSAMGEDATHYLDNPEKLCRVLAEILRNLHSQSTKDFPVVTRLQRYIDSVDDAYPMGNYDEFVLMDRFRIGSEQEAWDIIRENKHKLKCDTLIHGDFCLPNVVLDDWKFSSLIDFSMSGVGDKHVDIYWALWSLQYNLKTDAYTDYFLDVYGREYFDYDMLKVIAAFEMIG